MGWSKTRDNDTFPVGIPPSNYEQDKNYNDDFVNATTPQQRIDYVHQYMRGCKHYPHLAEKIQFRGFEITNCTFLSRFGYKIRLEAFAHEHETDSTLEREISQACHYQIPGGPSVRIFPTGTIFWDKIAYANQEHVAVWHQQLCDNLMGFIHYTS